MRSGWLSVSGMGLSAVLLGFFSSLITPLPISIPSPVFNVCVCVSLSLPVHPHSSRIMMKRGGATSRTSTRSPTPSTPTAMTTPAPSCLWPVVRSAPACMGTTQGSGARNCSPCPCLIPWSSCGSLTSHSDLPSLPPLLLLQLGPLTLRGFTSPI